MSSALASVLAPESPRKARASGIFLFSEPWAFAQASAAKRQCVFWFLPKALSIMGH